MRKVARLLAVLLLFAATVAASSHGHLGSVEDRAPCATCAFAGSSAAASVLPRLPAPIAVERAPERPIVDAPGFAPPPLSRAPKHGPPAARLG